MPPVGYAIINQQVHNSIPDIFITKRNIFKIRK
jgi:hypothetical protein